MRYIWSVLIAMMFAVSAAEAAKFGGGKSFGYKKPIQYRALDRQTSPKQIQPTKQAAAAAAGQRSSGMGGLLGGLVAGGLLAALFFGGAFDGMAPADWLLIALLAGGLWFFLRHRARQRQVAYAGAQTSAQEELSDQLRESRKPLSEGIQIGVKAGQGASEPDQASAALPAAPAWFDPESFSASAVENYLAVQRAWDSGDKATLESYCTAECFAEIADKIQAGEHQTEVESVDADIIDWDYDQDQFIVSVRFSGFVKENGAPARGFTEVWHLSKPVDGQGTWKIAGVQQL